MPPPLETEANEEGQKGLFDGCSFIVIKGSSLAADEARKLKETLTIHDGEAQIDAYDEGDDLSLDGITHIIAVSCDFPDYEAACDAMIPTVKPTWIDHSLAKNKLANPRQYSPDPRFFLHDVVACCADLPDGDADAIAGGILAMGGQWTSKLTSQVTHIVALTVDNYECETATKKGLRVRMVLPHWFDDCLKLGRKIDEQPYLLPDPDILRQSDGKLPPMHRKAQVNGATSFEPSSSPPPTPSTTRKQQTIFKNKKVMLGDDLQIGPHLLHIIEDIILNGGGKITSAASACDLFICKFRQGPDYKTASQQGKHVGNLSWLYHLITTDTWISPLRRLLHYPIAPDGLPSFKGFKISLSNYTGEARVYLENLILASGAQCTKTLKQDNTHLITAHDTSEKCAAAKDWGIHLVNHLWLEESYARWKLQSESNTRYTHFPRKTNLGEVVGQTSIDRSVLEKTFFQPDTAEARKDSPPSAAMQQVDINADDRSQAVETKRGHGRWRKGSTASSKPAEQKTPAASKFVPTGKENITPSATSSRKSKDAAAARLHDMTPDIALYEKEKKRVGGVVYGGRRKNDEARVDVPRKRQIQEAEDADSSTDQEAKKQKKGRPPPAMQLLISSYPRWTGQPKVEDADKNKLRHLGVAVTSDPARATHLAAPNIVRTMKFVTAMAYAPQVISTEFIDECLKKDRLLKPADFELKDKANEKRLGFSLQLSRERAKENQNKLLGGRSVYCLENVTGGFESYKAIVEANGGECMTWRNRKGTMVRSTRAESEPDSEEETQNEVYLLIGPDKDERLWQRFREMAERSRHTPRIVRSDWLIESAMCQKILPTGTYEPC